MVDFAKSAALAKRLVEANGRTVELLRQNRTAADPSAPWRGPSFAAEPAAGTGGRSVEVLACFVPVGGSGLGRSSIDEGTTVVRSAQQVALVAAPSAAGIDLSDFDVIRDGVDVWKIIAIHELRPAGTSVLWSIEVTR